MTHRTRIKVCGLRREADVAAAVEAGADAIGFVFYAKSPRAITPPDAARLARVLPPFVMPVGLFVNASDAELGAALDAVPNMLIQFHGDETAAQCERVQRPYIRAARMAPGFDLLNFAASFTSAQAILLDAHVDGYGGGGKVFDWSLVPQGVRSPLVLSGGLSAANVADGIAHVRPWAVDVSSGVESSKGVKDPGLIHEFCRAVRQADERLAAAGLDRERP
ncbi:phosphoribosylanthranilate isomerase [Roseateles paludis]|jgi:phosphoribosylanthranilate isomerase|uniref:N-(5'-phosphoribosyl)anthranilate isomerase n=1 Tax=Roseateles paludis TaxID=3145238 RepID=A0ABV0G5I7_9BURK